MLYHVSFLLLDTLQFWCIVALHNLMSLELWIIEAEKTKQSHPITRLLLSVTAEKWLKKKAEEHFKPEMRQSFYERLVAVVTSENQVYFSVFCEWFTHKDRFYKVQEISRCITQAAQPGYRID